MALERARTDNFLTRTVPHIWPFCRKRDFQGGTPPPGHVRGISACSTSGSLHWTPALPRAMFL